MTSLSKRMMELPVWLETFRQDDEIQAASYEGCPADFRASLKTAIAFAFHLWGDNASEQKNIQNNPYSGFAHTLSSKPAAWTLAILSPDYAAPARFIAALLPAILAGCHQIYIVCAERSPSPALCTALELTGLEDIFVVPQSEQRLDALVKELTAMNTDGRILFFPACSGEFSKLRHNAANAGCPCWQEGKAPHLAVLEDDAKYTDVLRSDIIAWAHGLDAICSDSANADAIFKASVYGTEGQILPQALVFGSGMEGCWVHKGLTPDWFRTTSLCASFYSSEN